MFSFPKTQNKAIYNVEELLITFKEIDNHWYLPESEVYLKDMLKFSKEEKLESHTNWCSFSEILWWLIINACHKFLHKIANYGNNKNNN